MNQQRILFIVAILMLLQACSFEEEKNAQVPKESEVEIHLDTTIQTESIKEDQIEANHALMENDEPPFKFPCDFDFKYMGIIQVSDSRWEEIQCGKGWDSRKGSCTWVYGEHIYNNFFPDSIVTEYRTHLVDLDSSQIEMTPEFLQSDLFKSHLIVTTINGKDIFKTVWDPNKTGKYPKPPHWIDE